MTATLALGAMHSASWQTDPKHLAFTLARYHFVARMLSGRKRVLEVGCGEGTGARIVQQVVTQFCGIDVDKTLLPEGPQWFNVDILAGTFWPPMEGDVWPYWDAVYALDVLEHITPKDQDKFFANINQTLHVHGVVIIGTPSLESQRYASSESRKHHVNCVLPGAIVEGCVAGALKSFYAGPATEIITAKGHRLSITSKHPVLTTQGWVVAGSLRQGMKLLTKKRDVPGVSDGDEYPLPIEQIFSTLALGGSCLCPASVDDLHGDARFVKSDINVVFADWRLLRHFQAERAKFVSDSRFVVSHVPEAFVAGLGASQKARQWIALPAPSLMGGGGLLRASVFGHLAPFDTLRLGASANWDIVPLQESGDSGLVNSESIGELIRRSAGQVELDELIGLRRFEYVGHVYDLQTVAGYHTANGVYISNCRTEESLRGLLRMHYHNVFLFGMNDMTLHCGFGPMVHYRLAICTEKR